MLITASRLIDSLNVSKTSYMIISDQKNPFDFKIRDSILTKVSTVKFLGVTLDENFSFTDYVNKVTTKISKSVGVLSKLHGQFLADVMVKLYTILLCIPILLMCYWRVDDRDILYAGTIECAHRRARK